MLNEKIDVYKYFGLSRGSLTGGYLQLYFPASRKAAGKQFRGCQLIIPGGGYSHVSPREGEPVALRFVSEGLFAAVLTYSVNAPYPAPLTEACLAVKYLRQNAEILDIDPKKICAVGFSAGGHLAGLLATLKNGETVFGSAKELKPDAVILSYPVVTMKEEFTHAGTRKIITDNGKITAGLSVDERVTEHSAPAFIWHTFKDEAVPVENSIMLARAYRACGASVELHIFENGGHGLSLATPETANGILSGTALKNVGEWVNLSLNWLRTRGIL